MGHRYIGSKEKLSDIIIKEIKIISPKAKTVIDLMAVTGLFSLALREKGYFVTASDVMTYSFHHLNVLLKQNDPPNFKRVLVEEKIEINCTTLFQNTNYEIVLDYLNHLSSCT